VLFNEMKMVQKIFSGLQNFRRGIGAAEIPASDLSENETQDNVSMNHFKNTLTAFVRQVGRGGNTKWQ